jgi:predicted nucleic acid-binding protein
MRAVLDTNVLISAFVTDGLYARILHRARNGEFTFVLCASVLEEFRRILRDKFGFDNGEVAFFAAPAFAKVNSSGNPEGLERTTNSGDSILNSRN